MRDFYYKNVDAYKRAKELTIFIYGLLSEFPPYETYGLADQLRRATISVPSNIAEGMGRMSIKKEFTSWTFLMALFLKWIARLTLLTL